MNEVRLLNSQALQYIGMYEDVSNTRDIQITREFWAPGWEHYLAAACRCSDTVRLAMARGEDTRYARMQGFLYGSGAGLPAFAKQALESGILDRLGGCEALAELFQSYDHDRDNSAFRST